MGFMGGSVCMGREAVWGRTFARRIRADLRLLAFHNARLFPPANSPTPAPPFYVRLRPMRAAGCYD